MQKRFVIIGVPGAGKTTLAKQLASCIMAPHIELDVLYWEPNWQPAPRESFHERLRGALTEHSDWVVDGTYLDERDITWSFGATVVWLDFSFGIVFRRMARRTFQRFRFREVFNNGNRETLRMAFFDLLAPLKCWFLTGSHHRRSIEHYFWRPEYMHLQRVWLRTPSEADAFLKGLREECAGPSEGG